MCFKEQITPKCESEIRERLNDPLIELFWYQLISQQTEKLKLK